MGEVSTQPALVAFDDRGMTWMSLCVPAALSVQGWDIGDTDDETILPRAIKAGKFEVLFYWSDTSAVRTSAENATHLALKVTSAVASENECIKELTELVQRLHVAAAGTQQQLAP